VVWVRILCMVLLLERLSIKQRCTL
jgi:hypothetical protein